MAADVAALLEAMRTVDVPAMEDMDVTALRAAMHDAALPGSPAVGYVSDLSIELDGRTLAGRLYRPSGTPAPLLVFFHGGGWVFGDLDGIDAVCRHFALAGFTVMSSTYRLAPEHPFPAAYDDAVAVARWATAHAAELGGDGRLAVGGESAGANIAAAAASSADLAVDLQVLLYPPVDADFTSPSMLAYADGYILTRAGMEFFWDAYVGDGDRDDPRVALLHTDPTTTPPTILASAGFDPLLDGNLRYVDHLADGGAVVEHLHHPGQLHGFAVTAPVVASSRGALEAVADRAAAHLNIPTPVGQS